MKHIISIDDRCIGCMKCVTDCPQSNIALRDGLAYVISENCIKCGHCAAICPQDAVSISGYVEEPIEIANLNVIKSDELLNSLMSRRSIRQFKDMNVSDEDIAMIIDAGRWTPTAKNSQGVSYIVIDRDKRKLEDIAVALFRRLIKILRVFKPAYKDFEIDDDFFFKGAPVVIGVVSENPIDAALASTSMSLMAESLGLGVLYSGFFSAASRVSPKLKRELGLRKKKLVATLVIGHPNVKYVKSAQKDVPVVTYM